MWNGTHGNWISRPLQLCNEEIDGSECQYHLDHFGGLLTGKVKKVRQAPQPSPSSAAYAMFAGYLTGLRGEQLLDSAFAALVSSNRSQLLSALRLASARGLLSLKSAAGIVEFDFSSLLTSAELGLLNESH